MLLTKRLNAEALAAAEFLTASVALPICFLISSDLVFVVLFLAASSSCASSCPSARHGSQSQTPRVVLFQRGSTQR